MAPGEWMPSGTLEAAGRTPVISFPNMSGLIQKSGLFHRPVQEKGAWHPVDCRKKVHGTMGRMCPEMAGDVHIPAMWTGLVPAV
jgi:hypothetical protein